MPHITIKSLLHATTVAWNNGQESQCCWKGFTRSRAQKKKRFVSYRHDLRPVGWRTTRLPCVFGYFRSNSTSDSWRTEVCYFRPVSTDSISYLHKSRSILTSVCLGYFTMCFFQSRPQYFMTLYHLLQNKQEKSELKSNLQRKQWCDFLLQYMQCPFLIYFTVLGNVMLKSLIIKQISLTPKSDWKSHKVEGCIGPKISRERAVLPLL